MLSLVLSVVNGQLTEGYIEALSQARGAKSQGGILYLEVEGFEKGLTGDEKEKVQIKLDKLNELLQTDALFTDYVKDKRKEIRSSFRLPPILTGESDTRTYTYYYRYAVNIEYSDNFNPNIVLTSPLSNQMLTENATLSIQGTASDIDKDNVVTVKYQVNKGTARALQSGVSNGSTPISFAKTLTFRAKRLYDGTTDITGSDLAQDTDYTLTVWAEDDQGGKSTEITRKFRVVHNRPPVISGQNEDLGTLSSVPMKKYTVTEPEGDTFTITEKINGKAIRTFAGTDKMENTLTIPLDMWLRLSLTEVHTLTIEATDSKGLKSTRTFTFRRSADKIAFSLKKPFDTTIAAKRILITIDATVPPGADYKVEVCNNAFDESPTWEDATNHVKFNRGFIFTNKEKTAEKWGVSVRFVFVKGVATESVIVRGFGGAFD
ncbi:Ig-like domain-containing protein [Brevibacillus laterosporus]|uniref:Ig-like domain-containing protein n=2 Tax=Brevibacillus laterosporus TaxID=1465 RepID=UPI001F093040|nr:Ig-like domain-containing protein [Brevibacillus laterosporus]